MHTDRGSQYASEIHRRLLEDYQIIQSISRKENCWDNSAMESFFKTLKVELVYPQRYATRAHARLDIVSCMEAFTTPSAFIRLSETKRRSMQNGVS